MRHLHLAALGHLVALLLLLATAGQAQTPPLEIARQGFFYAETATTWPG